MIGFVVLGIVMLLWILTWETWDCEDPADVPAPPLTGGERHV